MADRYAIKGYAESLDGPVTMYESDSYDDCVRWQSLYTRFGDWGGYDVLALFEIAPSESTLMIHLTDSPIITWERESV